MTSNVWIRSLIALVVLCLSLGAACAEIGESSAGSAPSTAVSTMQETTPPGGDSGQSPFDVKRILTRFEFWLSLLILIFGVIVVLVQFLLLRGRHFDGNDILKVFGVTLIVVGTLFLIASGFGDKQIASAMGLFGTLAGYLLGKSSGASGGDRESQSITSDRSKE
jgi:hypothetical protein